MKKARNCEVSLLLLVFVMLLFETNVLADDLFLNDKEQYQFAIHLYRMGEYYRAISEFQRLSYFFPDSSLVEKSKLQIGRAYMAGNRIDDAISYWQLRLNKVDPMDETYNIMKILLGISLLDKNRADVFRLREENIEAAFDHFADIKHNTVETQSIGEFVADWRSRTPPPQKSPWLAGTLSAVVPGAGSYYLGRYMEGTYAFFITGLFYIAAMDAIRNEQNEAAVFFGFFSIAFYGGNIYTSINSAHKLNDKATADDLFRMRSKHGIWFIPESHHHKGRY